MSFQITGTGSYVPERIITNDDLSKMVDTSDEWIMKRIGVRERHVSETETTADLGMRAAEKALADAGIKAEDLDLIIGSTITAETVAPGLACVVQTRLGATCPAFDVAAACSGFLFLLDIAAGYFSRGTVKKVLLVSAERLSGIVDWTDRGTCCIFGDGAGAVVLEAGDSYLNACFTTQGDEVVITIPTKKELSPFYKNEEPVPGVRMKGQETYKFAVNTMITHVRRILEQSGVSGDDIALVVPHQANYRIISEAARRMPEISSEKFCVNIDRYGNTSSASVPILLDELNRAGRIHKGDYVLLAAFGGGLSSGACLLKW